MASYFQNITASLPSFTSSSSNTPPPRGTPGRPPLRGTSDTAHQTTTSNLSSLGSALSSRLTSLRRALTSGAEDDDPDSEDSSHISKVMRAYYTEKGRPFPNWLPPDPKAPAPPPMPPQQQSQWGGFNQQQTPGRGAGGGLSDLWEENGDRQGPPMGAGSLRRQGGGTPGPRPGFVGSQPSSASSLGTRGRAQSPGLGPDYGGGGGGGARPLPSQRAGSYQQSQTSFSSRRPGPGVSEESYASTTSNTSTGSGGKSARDRLRAGLTGGRSSPTPPTPPAQQQSFRSDYGGSQDSGRGGSYRDERQGSYSSNAGGGGGGYGQRDQKPFMGASSPWASGEDDYGAGGGRSGLGMGYGSSGGDAGYTPGGGGGLGRRAPPGAGGGLPSGPKPRGPR